MNNKACHSLKDAPCKGCDNRTETCHGSCEKYAEYRAYRDAVNAEKERIRNVDEYIIKQMARRKKKHGKR